MLSFADVLLALLSTYRVGRVPRPDSVTIEFIQLPLQQSASQNAIDGNNIFARIMTCINIVIGRMQTEMYICDF